MKMTFCWVGVAGSILATVCGVGVTVAREEKQGSVASPELAAQVGTCLRILKWEVALVAYRKDYPRQELPRSLRALADAQGGGVPESFLDGWGRPLIYFVTHDGHYAIASFGKNGVPEGQAAEPGGATPGADRDADIVLIDGAWAQTPGEVGGLSW